MMTLANQPAFPQSGRSWDQAAGHPGMSYREWLAGQIMAAYTSQDDSAARNPGINAGRAIASRQAADALISELEKAE